VSERDVSDTETGPVQFMSQMTAVEYRLPKASALATRISEAISEGRIIGHECPECGKVYVPPRGYCPLCSVPTTDAHEVDIAPRGTITTFSIITPLQYQGQEEKDDYVQATILLDGSHSTLGMQRIEGVPIAEVHTGMRVVASWRDPSERKISGGSGGRNLALGEAISGWAASGEPDAPTEQYADYIV
jgi:uncharacterized OB-fold protein